MRIDRTVHRTTRREALALLSAAGCSALLPTGIARAQNEINNWRIIDTHHHIYPPRFLVEALPRIMKDAPGFPEVIYKAWSPRWALEQMDKGGVASAVTSITSPGIWYDDGDKARTRARLCNEFGAQMGRDYPGRFGMFATIPLPDTEGSLREIAYAFDVLKLDGIGLLTSYAGKLLGDPAFNPVFAELNRRKAVVFVHPTMSCCGNVFPGVIAPTLEFPIDSVRAITSLLFRGGFATYPDIKFIFSHGGGALPGVEQRLIDQARVTSPEQRQAYMPKGVEYELRRQYYDIASIVANRPGMSAVMQMFPLSQITFGSDTPFGSPAGNSAFLAALGLSAEELQAIRRDNALRLFPRFAV